MNLKKLTHTPPPAHVFGIEAERILYGRLSRRRDALERSEKAALTPGWSRLGPVGLLHVERPVLAAALVALVGQLPKAPARASLVVPDAWIRSLVVDVESLPRQRAEAEEVVRWRLKRVLPCRPDDVRLDFLPTGSNGRVLVSLVLDKPLSAVEDTFAAHGIELGRIEPVSSALTPLLPASATPVLLAVAGEQTLSMLLVSAGRVVLARQKTLPVEAARVSEFVLRELGRTLDHAKTQESAAGTIEVWLVTGEELAEDVQRWAAHRGALSVRRLAVGPGRFPASWSGDEASLWPMLGCAWAGEA